MTKPIKASEAWSVRDAKAHFSEVFERALVSPQRVVRAPRAGAKANEVVVMSAMSYERLVRPKLPLGEFMASLAFDKFEPARDETFERDVDMSP
jgi:hypothetical protein